MRLQARPGYRYVIFIVLVAFCCSVIPAPAVHAAMLDTGAVLENNADEVRDHLKGIIEKDEVRRALEARGISASEAHARVDALSDSQVRQVAQHLDSMPSGQGLGAVVGAVVFIFVVLLITDIAGVTDVFPFVK